MSRNSQGLYTLPLPPVRPAELIESAWANTTMDDIASALTGSLPRDGSAPMVGPLILSNDPITASQQATSKAYVDSFIAFASGLPIGSVVAYAGVSVPAGYFECNGQAISRTTYATLFTAIGVTYGSGDGSTTFNVPDMRDEFIRGKSDSRAVGNKQSASFAAHTHTINDPGHTHTQQPHSHTVSTVAHTHGVSDPGHVHSTPVGAFQGGNEHNSGSGNLPINPTTTGGAVTGISLQSAAPTGTAAAATPTNDSTTTGVTNGATGGEETRPQNIAQIYIIKAAQDSSGPATLTGITTSDAQMISVDNTNPVTPELVIHSNVAFGTVKLDASGQIPLNLLPTGSQQLLGFWDASGGQTPSQASPSTDYSSGDTYIISVTGTLTVYDPVTLTASPTVVAVGSLLQYVENSITNPTGWYYVVASTTVVASQVGLTPVGNIGATNVQAGFAEVDGDLTTLAGLVAANGSAITALQTADTFNVKQSSVGGTGAALIPAGTTAERDTSDLGAFRYNLETNTFEGLSNNGWGQVGGGQMYGTAAVKAIFYNAQSIGEDITVAAGQNGLSAGPVTVDNGFAVTVANGSVWTVV